MGFECPPKRSHVTRRSLGNPRLVLLIAFLCVPLDGTPQLCLNHIGQHLWPTCVRKVLTHSIRKLPSRHAYAVIVPVVGHLDQVCL